MAANEIFLREAQPADIPAMAEIRAADWGTQPYWRERIGRYLNLELHPGDALRPRIAFVCECNGTIVGLIAGHLTRRLGCDGELEWVSVRSEYRNRGIASQLLRRLADWFIAQRAKRICVDVEPGNDAAQKFYARHTAIDLQPHWMVWENITTLANR